MEKKLSIDPPNLMNIPTMKSLWGLLPHPTSDHVVRLFAKRGDEKIGDFAATPGELRRFVNSCNLYNCYVAPNPTTSKTGLRHDSSDVTHWSYLFFDIDPVEPNAVPTLALEETLKIFGGWCGRDLVEKYRPTIIDSGRGVQAWLRTDDFEFQADDPTLSRKVVRRIVGYWLKRLSDRLGLAHGCKLDTSCSDLPRVMRIPGTVNIKTGTVTKLLHAQERPFPWLIPFLHAGCPREATEEVYHVPCPGLPWQMAFTKLTPTAQRYIQNGKEEPGRHSAAFHVAKSFQELGIDRNEARKALRIGNPRLGPSNEMATKDLEHALDSAYGYDN